jgi:hypothetical protein
MIDARDPQQLEMNPASSAHLTGAVTRGRDRQGYCQPVKVL